MLAAVQDAVAAALVHEPVAGAVALDEGVVRRQRLARHAEVVVLEPADGGAVGQGQGILVRFKDVSQRGHGGGIGDWRLAQCVIAYITMLTPRGRADSGA